MKQSSLPILSLSNGQLLWAVSLGHEPSDDVRDRARYLRLLGVPRPILEGGPGRGQRVLYDFDDLVLVGLGLLALTDGYKPGKIREYLVDQRQRLLREVHEAWLDLPAEILNDPVCKSRLPVVVVYQDDFYVRLAGRSRQTNAKLEFLRTGVGANPLPEMVEVIPGELPAKVYSLKQWMPKWVAWALEAPATPPGPKA